MNRIYTNTELITPIEAQRYLERNQHNRKIKPSNVAFFVKELQSNKFEFTHQGIAFDPFGNLIDGQHRLTAIVKTGISATMQVTHGLPLSTRKIIDGGVKRTSGDKLDLSAPEAAIVNFLASLLIKNNGISVPTAVLEKAKDIIGDEAEELKKFAPSSIKYFSSAAIAFACCFYMKTDPFRKKYVMDLYRALTIGETDALPPVGHAFIRQYLTGKLDAKKRKDTLYRGLYVLNPDNKNKQKFGIQDEKLAGIYQFVLNGLGLQHEDAYETKNHKEEASPLRDDSMSMEAHSNE